MRFVLDCSVAVSWCFEDEVNRYSEAALGLLSEGEAIVPPVWQLEVTNVLVVAERKKRITEAKSSRFLELLRSLPISEESSPLFLPCALLLLAREHKLSAYDASYLELAMRSGLPLATMDGKLKSAAKRSGLLLKAG